MELEQLIKDLQECKMIKQFNISISAVTIIAEFSLSEGRNAGDALTRNNDKNNSEKESNSELEILSRQIVTLEDDDSDLEILNDNNNNHNKSSMVTGRIRNRRKSSGRITRRRTSSSRPKSLINPRKIDDDNDELDNYSYRGGRLSFLSKKAKITIGTRKTRKRPLPLEPVSFTRRRRTRRRRSLDVDDETEADDEAEEGNYTSSEKTIGNNNKKRKLH